MAVRLIRQSVIGGRLLRLVAAPLFFCLPDLLQHIHQIRRLQQLYRRHAAVNLESIAFNQSDIKPLVRSNWMDFIFRALIAISTCEI